jgi:hypothetical protein
LEDLRGAAVTVLGCGDPEAVAGALRAMEVGEKTGTVPFTKWRSPLQDDFGRNVREFNLTRFLSGESAGLVLDLRAVSGDEPLARRRSAFFHRLRALEIPFAAPEPVTQARASWKEAWTLRYTPETEIALAEAVSYGVTVGSAAAGVLTAALSETAGIAETAELAGQALRCDLPALFAAACAALRDGLAHSGGFTDAVRAADTLDRLMQAGTNRETLTPLLRRLCLRACLALPAHSYCGDEETAPAAACIQTLHRLFEAYADTEELDSDQWREAVARLAGSADANPRLSGLAFALRLEYGEESAETLVGEIYRRLSPAFPVEHAAGWLDGLASRNRRALLAIPGLWTLLDEALSALDETRFRRALVPLRRMFSRFSERDKRDIAAQLTIHWESDLSDITAEPPELTEWEREALAELEMLEME